MTSSIGRSKKNIKNRIFNTNDSFFIQLFRSPIILLGFLFAFLALQKGKMDDSTKDGSLL